MIKLINTLFRYLVALVFVFSGFVKLVDPYGTAYKIADYLETVHINLPFGLALIISMILSISEFTLGLNALFKSCYRVTSILLLAFVSLFTLLTLYIAIADPVQDCGCFGDALVISNWQTFGKNIIILILSIVIVRNRNYMRNRVEMIYQKLLTFSFILIAFIIALSAVRHLPFMDFRPYAVGAYIPEQMKVPEGMPQDVYETIFIYEKGGEQEEFTEDNYPWQDTTWSYVDSKTTLISEGAEAPIHDFVIEHPEMGDITLDVLEDDNYSFLLVAPHLDKSSLKHLEEIENIKEYCDIKGYRFLVLTSSIDAVVSNYKSHFKTSLEVCNMDEITLKTIVRSHPGLVILKGGTVLEKYHHNDLPNFIENEDVLASVLRQKERQKNQIIVLLLGLLIGGLVYLLFHNRNSIK